MGNALVDSPDPGRAEGPALVGGSPERRPKNWREGSRATKTDRDEMYGVLFLWSATVTRYGHCGTLLLGALT